MRLCLYCKRSHLSELCPLYLKALSITRAKHFLNKESFEGSAPGAFVGRFGYPNVNVGILSVPEIKEESWLYDAPRFWAEKEFEIPEIVDFRSSLINSRFNIHIKKQDKFLDIAKEVGMASKPAELELNLKEKPKFRFNIYQNLAPTGPNAELVKAELTSNPKIHTKVEKVVNDEIKAGEAVAYLYESRFDENFLSRLLSVGTLGLGKDKKLVPTRFSITAVDDILGKKLISEVKDFTKADYSIYFGGYLGNYYLILFSPDIWSYELFEMNANNVICYTTDYESYEGRKTYAAETAGGYYAARLGILEHLKKIKRQAGVLALRFITSEYTIPLGVFVCREATRKALKERSIGFASEELMLKYAKEFVRKKFGADVSQILRRSILLKERKQQMRLGEFE